MNISKKAAIESLDSMEELFKDVADEIWEHPELSLKEHRAAELYCRVLREHGFAVTEKLCGMDTAFCGSYGSGRPVIGILGEFDALSGLSQAAGMTEKSPTVQNGAGHGCGHNLLGAGSLAAAFAVKDHLERTGREGTVVFFGCPGEEGGSGKAFMAREGMWRKLDAAVSWHPSDVTELKTGTNNSSIQVLYRFKGLSAHAASSPEQGRSALDAVELMNIGAQFLREHMTGDCRIHYAILNTGGVSPNVVQSEAEVLYMVRANMVRDCVKLLKRVDKLAEGASLMTETEYERVYIDGTSELLPNFTLERLMYDNMEEIPLPQYTDSELDFAEAIAATYPHGDTVPGIGAQFDDGISEKVAELCKNSRGVYGFLMPMYSGTGFVSGSTDVGDVSWQTPTAQINVTAWPRDMTPHTWQTTACGKSGVAYKGMLYAGKVLAGTVIDLIEKPELLAAAQAEFKKRSASGYLCPIEDGVKPTAL